jgi:hypothetical protein
MDLNQPRKQLNLFRVMANFDKIKSVGMSILDYSDI